MPRPKSRIPKLSHHKASGQGRVRIEGQDVYCGTWGSAECEETYRRTVAEWLQTGRVPEANGQSQEKPPLSINELILAFWKHAESYYVKPDGTATDEQQCIKSALRPLRELYGTTVVEEFGPLALKTVQSRMVEKGWCRRYVNKSVSRIRLMFRWGVANEMVSPITLQALGTVEGLKAGRTEAPDHEPRKPIPEADIEAVKGDLRKQRTRDMIDLQLLTGCRPGELLKLTTGLVDRSGDVWTTRLSDHKTRHQGKERILFFGPQAQLILRRYLKDKSPDEALFKIKGRSYSDSILKVCDRLGIERWCPHRLRHTAATRLREKYGLEATQVMLGHSKADVTQLYAQANVQKAVEVAQKAG